MEVYYEITSKPENTSTELTVERENEVVMPTEEFTTGYDIHVVCIVDENFSILFLICSMIMVAYSILGKYPKTSVLPQMSHNCSPK